MSLSVKNCSAKVERLKLFYLPILGDFLPFINAFSFLFLVYKTQLGGDY